MTGAIYATGVTADVIADIFVATINLMHAVVWIDIRCHYRFDDNDEITSVIRFELMFLLLPDICCSYRGL